MVSAGLVVSVIVAIVALSQLPRITGLLSGLTGGGNGDTSTTTVIEEGDITIVVEEGDEMKNTSDGKVVADESVPDAAAEVIRTRVTELDIAFEEGRFIDPDPVSTVNTSRLTSEQFNPIFFETLRSLDAEARRKIEIENELRIAQDIKFSTSLEGAVLREGEQLSRTDPDFQDKLKAEAERSEAIFRAQFGSVT